jgi:hypothetical protein
MSPNSLIQIFYTTSSRSHCESLGGNTIGQHNGTPSFKHGVADCGLH